MADWHAARRDQRQTRRGNRHQHLSACATDTAAGAWTAYIQAEAGLINAHKTQFDTLTQERNASITVSRLGINEVLDSAAAQLTGDIAALGQDVAVLTGWDSNPDVIRAPFNAALAAVEAGALPRISPRTTKFRRAMVWR